jgi:cell division protein FtsA
MNPSQKLIVGLDIGTTKICAIVAQRNENGKINILGIGKAPSLGGVTEGMVNNIQKTSDAIQKAVAEASKMSNVNIASVYVGIAGKHIKSFQQNYTTYRTNPQKEIDSTEMEEMRKQMYRMHMAPGTGILHVLPQEYKIDDNYSDDPVGMPGSKFECNYHIITGQILAAENIKRCVEKCGIEVADIVVEPIASAKAVLDETELKAGVAILDIGGGTSDLAIFKDGRIRHTAVIPLGGERITRDIMHAFNVMENHAEAMKVKYGQALPEYVNSNEVVVVPGIGGRKPKYVSVKNLSLVINACLQDIFERVDYEIETSGYKNRLTAGLVLTGGGAELVNIGHFLEYTTGLEVQLGFPNQHLAKGMVSEVKSPMYATGAGLVIYGMEQLMKENQNTPGTAKLNSANKASGSVKEKEQSNLLSAFKGFGGSFVNWMKDDDMEDFK